MNNYYVENSILNQTDDEFDEDMDRILGKLEDDDLIEKEGFMLTKITNRAPQTVWVCKLCRSSLNKLGYCTNPFCADHNTEVLN